MRRTNVAVDVVDGALGADSVCNVHSWPGILDCSDSGDVPLRGRSSKAYATDERDLAIVLQGPHAQAGRRVVQEVVAHREQVWGLMDSDGTFSGGCWAISNTPCGRGRAR